MNKHDRIVEIKGFKGLLTAIFIVCCLVTGFTVFPGFIAMHVWNLFVPYVTDMPTMNLLHGIMLWGVVFLIWFAFNGRICSLHFGYNKVMDEDEIKELVEKIKSEEAENDSSKSEE